MWGGESERPWGRSFAPGGAESRDSSPELAQPARILIIDDEFRVRRLIAKTLAGERYQVVAAPSAEAALELLREDCRFDLILSDVVMPQMSGAELFEHVRGEHPELARKFAFVTAGPNSGGDAARLRAHAVEVLLKPFTPEELLAFVRTQLARLSR